MKFFKKCKKGLIVMATAFTLLGGLAMPVMAHGHGGGHHSSAGVSSSGHHESSHYSVSADNEGSTKGYYCPYHSKTHKKKSNCKKYCSKHHKTHKNGKKHKCA